MKNKPQSTYVKGQRQKNEHMIPTELHSEEHHSWAGGWGKRFHSQDTIHSFGVFLKESESWTQGNLFLKQTDKPFIAAPWLLNVKKRKLMVVIKVKNKHDFLYQLTSERTSQISEEQYRQTVIRAKVQKTQMFIYCT